MVGEILPLTGFQTLSGVNADHHQSRCLSAKQSNADVMASCPSAEADGKG